MIVRNEEHELGDCLAPVAGLFDEIIIVDTGSSDATKDVAARFTPHVFDFPWRDDFAAARNEALRHARGDWIFWLDADDRLSAENVARLRQLLDTLDDQPRAYMMQTACVGQFACEGTQVVSHPRLFRRHPQLGWQGRVHEQLRPDLGSFGYEISWTDIQILHTGYQDPTIEELKLNRDVRLLRMDYAIDPDNTSTLLHLGLAYFRLDQSNEARHFLGRVLAAADAPADHLRQVYAALALLAQREGDYLGSLAKLNLATALFPDDEYLLYLLAECLYEIDQFAAAKVPLNRILAGGERHQYRGGVPGEIRQRLAPLKLADVLRIERQFGPAEQLLRAVVAQFPDDTHCWHMLGRVYLDSRQRVKLLSVIERLRSCPQGDVFAAVLLAVWHLEQQELRAAGSAIEEIIAKAPRMPMGRMLLIEWLTRIGAPVADRIQACRDTLRLQPGNREAERMLQALLAVERQAEAATPTQLSTSVVLSAGAPNGVGTA
jgi:tetratricopeptide (TPR) repeat protein